MVILVANVGERDLYYNVGDSDDPDFCHFELGKAGEQRVAKYLGCKGGARYIGEEILRRLADNYNEQDQRLRYPILKTVLDEVVGENRFLDRLILVVTDQPRTTAESFRCRDSLYTGEILKELIQRHYQHQVKDILIVPYGDNPANRERAYGFFGELLPRLAPEAEVEEFHAVLSGGVPALNDSLQEQALRLYKTKCRFYEVAPPEEKEARKGVSKCLLQTVSVKPFLRDLAISIIEELLRRYDYSGALEALEMFKPIKFWDEKVEALLRHAERRVDFDFQEAARAIAPHAGESPFREWHAAVEAPDELTQLAEVYYIAKARCEHREFAEFLWRVRLVQESSKEEIYAHLQDERWAGVREAHMKLGRLAGLAGRVLHPARGMGVRSIQGISAKTIEQAFGGSIREVMAVLEGLVWGLWRLQRPGKTFPENPYAQINDYIKIALAGR